MRISGRIGMGGAETALDAQTLAAQLAAIPPSPVGLIPACILGYGLISKSRTATIVGGIWAGFNFANWLGWKSRQSSSPVQAN